MQAFERRFYQFVLIAWLILSIVFSVAVLVNSYSDLTADLSLVTSLILGAILTLGISLFFAAAMLFWLALPMRVGMNLVLRERRKTHKLETLVLALIFAFQLAIFFAQPRATNHEHRRLAPSSVHNPSTKS